MPANADAILNMGRAYWQSRVLLTAAELDLFTPLVAAPQAAAPLAQQLSADERGLTVLLDALTALELLTKEDGQYQCPPEVAALLASNAPTTLRPMLQHYAGLWPRWSELTGVVRDDAAAIARARAPRSDEYLAAFIGAMHVIAEPKAADLVAAVQPIGGRTLLDVGGASGTYTLAFLQAEPELRATLFDRPAVVEMARRRIAAAGYDDRVTLVGGDFDTDPLPGDHDVVLLSAIIHQNSPAENVALFGKIFAALVPGGRVIIRDYVMSDDRTDPPPGTLFAVNMLICTAGGGVYTYADIEKALTEAGFERVRQVSEGPLMDALVEAYRPA